MSPHRQQIINGRKIEEYYWAGEMVVYIDNHVFTELDYTKTNESFSTLFDMAISYVEQLENRKL